MAVLNVVDKTSKPDPLPEVAVTDDNVATQPASPQPQPESVPNTGHEAMIEGVAGPVCVELGWFESEDEARRKATTSGIIPDSADVVEQAREVAGYHWVIIPPAETRAKALAAFREIQRRGIDSYLVTQGAKENAISLGLFESLDAAEEVLSRRQSQGLEATLATFPRNQIRYALVFEVGFAPGASEPETVLSDFRERYESVVLSGCEGVATAQKTP
ncbi:hypothetical protein [Marinobacter salicampi]|uniref:hypothetical protein n=1 Tax=Marinobacter salicampi TaxID=435907 RepID=UPI001408CF96|nr:hypothetical protein [Marinobacter salicampi]